MTGTAVEKRDQLTALKAQLDRFAPSYEKMLPAGYRPDRLITGALLAVQKNPDLAKCSAVSIATALGQVAQLGLDVGLTAHLVPYGASCTMVPDYKGFVELMCKAGARKVEAQVVREGEPFEYEYGTSPSLRHQPLGNPRAKITHAYAIVWPRRGDPQFHVMSAEEVDAIRLKHSKQWKSGELPAWYAKKTVVRQVAKFVPKTPALEALLAADDQEPPALVDLETGEVLEATVEDAPHADA